jgi:hypothetical protein
MNGYLFDTYQFAGFLANTMLPISAPLAAMDDLYNPRPTLLVITIDNGADLAGT